MNQDDLFHVLKDLVELYRMGGLTPQEFQETKKLLLTQLRDSGSLSSQTDLLGALGTESLELSTGTQSTSDSSESQMRTEIPARVSPAVAHPPAQSHLVQSAVQTHSGGTPSITIGQWLLGRYEIKEFLGEGGIGQTFRCYDSIRQADYALKWVYPHLTQIPTVREQILELLTHNEKLHDPGFVRMFSVEGDPQTPSLLFFTMEYVQGITLDRAIEQCVVSPGQCLLPVTFTLRLLEKVVALLSISHQHGIIHRNLKPANIGITEAGEVKLMDAGTIKALEHAVASRHTSFSGVLYYMAPEQLRQRNENITFSSDVYSLAAITYQLLTGELPIGAVVPPTQYVATLPRELDSILLKALDPRAHKRYQTTQEFWLELCQALAPIAAKENMHTETLYALLISACKQPQTGSVQFVDEVGSTSNELETIDHIASKGGFDAEKSLGQLDENSSTTSTDLPAARTFSSSLLTRRSIQDTESMGQTVSEIPKVRFQSTSSLSSLDEFDAEFEARWSGDFNRGIERSEEVISLEKGPTPAPPSQHTSSKKSGTHKTLISSEIERISVISALADEPLAEELELELEDDSYSPLESDLQRTALDLPSCEPFEEDVLCAKDGTPLLRMVLIPEGAFLMGSKEDDPLASSLEVPQQKVHLDAYWITRTPITNRVWSKFIEESGYHSDDPDYLRHWFGGRPGIERLEHPVVFVSHHDVLEFCSFYGLDLPSEAQWEKAARGDVGQVWPWGNRKPHPGICNFLGSSVQTTTPVGAYPEGASVFGLLDCCGNVWEWCADHWSKEWMRELSTSSTVPHNPIFEEPSLERYSIRGGCFRNYGRGVRCATRHYSSERAMHISARVIRRA